MYDGIERKHVDTNTSDQLFETHVPASTAADRG
jgi:hypothetical protein